MPSINIGTVVAFFGSQRKMADALGVTQPTVNHMISTNTVSTEVALRIQKQSQNRFLAVDLRPGLKEHFVSINVT